MSTPNFLLPKSLRLYSSLARTELFKQRRDLSVLELDDVGLSLVHPTTEKEESLYGMPLTASPALGLFGVKVIR